MVLVAVVVTVTDVRDGNPRQRQQHIPRRIKSKTRTEKVCPTLLSPPVACTKSSEPSLATSEKPKIPCCRGRVASALKDTTFSSQLPRIFRRGHVAM